MRNKIISIMTVLFVWVSAFAVDSVTLRIEKNDKSIENKTVQLERINKTTSRLRFDVKTLDFNNIRHIDVLADSAFAYKGDKGFWLHNRGLYGEFLADNGEFHNGRHYQFLPYYAMKTPKETFIAVIDGMRFEYFTRIEAKNGRYEMFPRFLVSKNWIGFDPYEDIVITYYTLPDSAGYVEMAKTFRKHRQASLPALKPMKERFKTQPLLEEQTKVIALRMSFANKKITLPREIHKKTDYTRENEPKIIGRPFSKGTEILKKVKALGVENVWVCTEGWQSGGYDGRTPDTWPICPEAGGEEELKKFIKAGQELGYLIDAHMDYSDCYTCAAMWTPDMVCKGPTGKLEVNGGWAGGRAYNLCLNYAWNKWIPSELEKIGKLGFKGGLFIDVLSAVFPYRCCDANHPLTRRQAGDIQHKVLKKSREVFGVVGSECEYDYYIDQLDYINYAAITDVIALRKMNDPLPDKYKGPYNLPYIVVPFWELAYHDCVISSPFRLNMTSEIYTKPEYVDVRLKLAEFCGRPIFYSVKDETLPAIKTAWDFYKRYRHLIPEEITNHTKLADGIYKTDFGNGASIIVNYNTSEFKYGSNTIPAKDFVVVNP